MLSKELPDVFNGSLKGQGQEASIHVFGHIKLSHFDALDLTSAVAPEVEGVSLYGRADLACVQDSLLFQVCCRRTESDQQGGVRSVVLVCE